MTVTWMNVGNTSATGATVVTKVTSGSNVRVAVSTSPAMTSPTYFGPVTPSAQNVARVSVSSLTASTQYYFQVEHAAVLDTTYTGRFTTLPTSGSVASYTVAVISCAGSDPAYPGSGAVLASDRLSNHPVFSVLDGHAPLVTFDCGDRHYYDLSSGLHGIAGGASLSNIRRAEDDVMLQTLRHQFNHRNPSVWIYDDHDFLGNDKRGLEDTTGAANVFQVYKEVWPHWTLGDSTDGIYQSVQIGRVLWVALDGRTKASANSATDNSSKTMLGSTQKTWLANTLAASTATALVVVGGSQWTDTTHDDSWAVFTAERDELLGIFDDNGSWLPRMAMGYGDRHALKIIPGSGNTHGGFPILMSSALDSTPSDPAVTDFVDIPGRGQYGLIRVDDLGRRGITITMTGYSMSTPVMWHSFSTTGARRIGAGSPSHVIAL